MDQRDELLTDKLQREKLYEHVVEKLIEQSISIKDHKTKTSTKFRQKEVNKIIASFRRKNSYNGNIETQITETIQSKLTFLNHVTSHIQSLRDQINALTTKIKAKTFECSICLHVLHADQLFKISTCGHELCRICIRRHIFSSIERKKISPKCPFYECDHELCHFDDLRAVLTESEYEKMNYDLNMNAISKLQGIKYCLTPDCDYAIEYDMSSCADNIMVTKFDCPKCEKSSCLKCGTGWHEGFESCKAWRCHMKLPEVDEKVADEKYSEWYNEKGDLVKECPGCHAHVEKSEGCNHVCVWICICIFVW